MMIFDEEPTTPAPRAPLGDILAPPERPAPSFGEVMRAGFDRSNEIGSVIAALSGSVGAYHPPEEGFSVLDQPDWRGSLYESDYADEFVAVRSRAEFDAVRARIDRERKSDQVLADAGVAGAVVRIGMGLASPSTFLPGGAIIRAARGGYSVGRSAASVGAAGFAAGVASETVFAASQTVRGDYDFAINVAASTILSGILGAGAAKLLTSTEARALSKSFAEDVARFEGRTPEEIAQAGATAGPIEGAPREPLATAPFAMPAGAAAVDVRTARVEGYGFDTLQGGRRIIERVSPVLYGLTSELQSARRVVADAFETALQTADNADFIATTRVGGPTAEREIKTLQREFTGAFAEVGRDAWLRYRFGSAQDAPVLAAERVALPGGSSLGMPGRNLTAGEFYDEVGRAMRRNDEHPLPEVAEVARWLRENITEPVWARAKAADPNKQKEYGDVAGAPSWFKRIYNIPKIKAEFRPATTALADWLEQDQARKFAIQGQIESLAARRETFVAEAAKLAAKVRRAEERIATLTARAAERAMEVARTGRRVDDLAERVGELDAELSELAEGIAALRAQQVSPEIAGRIETLQRDLAALRKAEKAATMSEADLAKMDEAELRERYLATPDQQFVADVVTGRRAPPKPPNFISWIIEAGGIRDTGGDVRALTGGKPRPGLINATGRDLDEWGEKIWNDFPSYFPERPTARDVEELLDEAMRGRPPYWFAENVMPPADQIRLELANEAAVVAEEMGRLGYDPKNRLEVARFLRDHAYRAPAGPERFDDAGIPPSVMAEAGENALAAATQTLRDIREAVARARTRTRRVERTAATNAARAGEAGMGARANVARMETLEGQRAAVEERRRIAAELLAITRAESDRVMTEIEDILRGWGGKTTAEAVSALRARDAAMVGRNPDLGRLESADADIMTAVRRVLASDRQLERREIEGIAAGILNRIIGTPDGRLPADDATFSAIERGALGPGRDTPRGSLARRTLMIPDEVLEPWLEDNAEWAIRSLLHSELPDIILTERYGDAMMTNALKEIQDEATALSLANPSRSTQIQNEAAAVIERVAGMRDRLRGTFAMQHGGPVMMRAATAVKTANIVLDLGGSVIASMSDVANGVMRYGLMRALGDGWLPYVRSLAGARNGFKEAAEQYRAAAIGSEVAMAIRYTAMDDISPLYRPTTRGERVLSAMGEKFQLANLQAPWTDMNKTIVAVVAGNEILRAAKATVEGTITAKQKAALAASGINENLARRIWAEFSRPGAGDVIQGTHVPNAERWQDEAARRAFMGAVGREADIAVVTPGQEKPLWLSKPVGSVLGQYKSFTFAATERILLANLQTFDAEKVGGLVALVAMGALSEALYNTIANRPQPERPQDWIKAGISRSGALGWFEEANTFAAKATSGSADIYRLIGADKPLSRYSSRSAVGQLLGPTAGKLENALSITGAPFSEDGWTARDTQALRRLAIPGQNLWYLRRVFDEIEDAGNAAFGVEPLERGTR